jgi:2-succinyl-6-hydroxy-2,4-cyclohexadiene-1-carboxylate synthase
MLNVPVHTGSSNANRIVLAHGFTQAGEVWRPLAERLAAAGYEVIAPDLPGHGATDPAHDSADLWTAGDLLAEAGGRAVYVGYSLGGRTLLHTALRHPQLVRGMILVGVSGGYRNLSEKAARIASDNKLARSVIDDFPKFIDNWLKHPVNERLVGESQTNRSIRLRNRPEGVAASLEHAGSGCQDALWEQFPSLNMPAVVAYTEFDTESILRGVEEIASTIGPNARLHRFDGVGHSAPFEAPELFGDFVETFAATLYLSLPHTL